MTDSELVAPSPKTGDSSLVFAIVIVIAMVSELLPASVAIRFTEYELSVLASAGFSKSVAEENAMRQVSASTLLGVKSAASVPLSVHVLTGSVLSASVRS